MQHRRDFDVFRRRRTSTAITRCSSQPATTSCNSRTSHRCGSPSGGRTSCLVTLATPIVATDGADITLNAVLAPVHAAVGDVDGHRPQRPRPLSRSPGSTCRSSGPDFEAGGHQRQRQLLVHRAGRRGRTRSSSTTQPGTTPPSGGTTRHRRALPPTSSSPTGRPRRQTPGSHSIQTPRRPSPARSPRLAAPASPAWTCRAARSEAAAVLAAPRLTPAGTTRCVSPPGHTGSSSARRRVRDWVSEYYNDVRDFSSATPVTVAAGATVANINAQLARVGDDLRQGHRAWWRRHRRRERVGELDRERRRFWLRHD